jgi:hypothetical protein
MVKNILNRLLDDLNNVGEHLFAATDSNGVQSLPQTAGNSLIRNHQEDN